jgi:Caspase domain
MGCSWVSTLMSKSASGLTMGVVVLACSTLGTCQAPAGLARPDVPDQYQRFFVHYSPNRSITSAVLSKAGLDDAHIGRSFALIAGISSYPNLRPADRDLTPAGEDVKKLADYLKNVEFFDEIVVLQNADVTFDNLAFFLQGYFPDKLQADSNSRLLIAYSGHGFTKGRSSFLVTYPAVRLDAKNPDMYNSLNLFNLRALVQYDRQYSHSVLALLNTCNSGDFLNRPFGTANFNIYDKSAFAITAGTEQQLAFSYGDVGTGSLFFEKMFAGLYGRANALYPNASIALPNIVTVDELYNYLVEEVQTKTSKRQTPKMGDLDEDGSTGLFYFLDRKKLVSENVIADWNENSIPSISVGAVTASISPPPIAATTSSQTQVSLSRTDQQGADVVGQAQSTLASTSELDLSVARARVAANEVSTRTDEPSPEVSAAGTAKAPTSAGGSDVITTTGIEKYQYTLPESSVSVAATLPVLEASWPPGAVEGGSYVVLPEDANRNIEYFKLPENFTLLFDPSVTEVNWRVHRLQFGKSATIDVSAPKTTIPPAPAGLDALQGLDPGSNGRDGGPGAQGVQGPNGIGLHVEVDTLVPRGNLWIRTDGAQGGSGGRGGNGQMGGGTSCGSIGTSHVDGGHGGNGGPGGRGGNGGSTSEVQLIVRSVLGETQGIENRYVAGPICSAACGRSVRPKDLVGDDGKILVYGQPGCGGPGGFGGAPGPGGDEGERKGCALLKVLFTGHVSGGPLGAPGRSGSPGEPGRCSAAQSDVGVPAP